MPRVRPAYSADAVDLGRPDPAWFALIGGVLYGILGRGRSIFDRFTVARVFY